MGKSASSWYKLTTVQFRGKMAESPAVGFAMIGEQSLLWQAKGLKVRFEMAAVRTKSHLLGIRASQRKAFPAYLYMASVSALALAGRSCSKALASLVVVVEERSALDAGGRRQRGPFVAW